jgi:hypothetical protein
MDNRTCIADADVISQLVPLLSSENPKTQENNASRVVEEDVVSLLVKRGKSL